MQSARYLKWLGILCLVLACFGTGVLLVGYQPASIGRVATIAVCAIAGIALLMAASRRKGQGR